MEQDIDDPDVIDAEVLVARIASLESKIAALVNVMISKGWSREVARYPIFGVVAYKQDESL